MLSTVSHGRPKETAGAALEGIRVLDMSRVIAGPWSAQILADLGADVLKVERPKEGDDSRSWAPPYMRDDDGHETDQSVSFAACNRGKRSIELNFSIPEHALQVRDLAAQADVLIENYKVGTLRRYGLDYESLAQVNPRLIYCSITGFGQTGPYRDRPGYDTIIQGLSGLMSITGQPDDVPGGGPVKIGLPVVDLMTGQYAALAIMAALVHRTHGGRGQFIDMALLDVGVASLAHLGLKFLSGNGVPKRHGNRLPMVAPSDSYSCTDGRVLLIVGNDLQFRKMCAALDIPHLATDARFSTNAARLANAEALNADIGLAICKLSVAECVARCSESSVPCGPINDVASVFADPQVIARELVQRVVDREGRTSIALGSPIRLSETPVQYRRAAPQLGDNNLSLNQDSQGRTIWPD